MYGFWRILVLLVATCIDNSVIIKDDVKIQEETAIKQEGSCVTINCTYTTDFHQNTNLFWLKDAVWNQNKSRFEGTTVYSNWASRRQAAEFYGRVEFPANKGSCTLRITNLQKNDSGVYNFRFINEHTKFMSRMNMNLTVKDNPCKVHLELSAQSGPIKEGDTVILHCGTSVACGHAPKWDTPGIKPMITTSSTKDVSELKFNVSWTDDGRTLSCHPAKSKDDCLVRNVMLTVEYAPKDTKVNVSSKDVKEGERVNMSCTSKAKPNATFTWFKVSHPSQVNQPFHYLKTFDFDEAKRQDSGTYYCRATNIHGEDDSQNITINVTYAPKGVRVQFEASDVQVGDTLTLKCLVKDSNPTVMPGSFTWYKDGKETGKHSDTLFIQQVVKNNKGWYHCQAKNSVGAKDSNQIEVSVKYRPQKTNITGTQTVKLHLSLTLTCYTDANPHPTSYFWFHKPEQEQNYVDRSHTHQEYKIEKVTIQDAGWYMCCSRNVVGMGSNSTPFRVDVHYAPKEPILTMVRVIKESELLRVGCTVESFPVASITLIFRNPENKEVVLETVWSNTLEFSANASESGAGLYICTAENPEGQNTTALQLKVLYAPKNVQVVAHPGQDLKEANKLLLTCDARSEPVVSSYTWEKSSGAHRETVGQEKNLTMQSLNALNSGDYICIARNYLGSNQSAPVHIRVKHRPSIKLLHNMTAMRDQALPVHLMCSAQCDPPATSYAWYKLEDNTTALSTNQNYTAQPQSPGTYYCFATNDIGTARSEPIQLFVDPPLKLFQVLSPVLILCIMIVGIFLL